MPGSAIGAADTVKQAKAADMESRDSDGEGLMGGFAAGAKVAVQWLAQMINVRLSCARHWFMGEGKHLM